MNRVMVTGQSIKEFSPRQGDIYRNHNGTEHYILNPDLIGVNLATGNLWSSLPITDASASGLVFFSRNAVIQIVAH